MGEGELGGKGAVTSPFYSPVTKKLIAKGGDSMHQILGGGGQNTDFKFFH
jgi:hypothetical protein